MVPVEKAKELRHIFTHSEFFSLMSYTVNLCLDIGGYRGYTL